MNITIDHDGVTYYGTVMTIKSTMLGEEDHGIFTSYLMCEGSGSGVGLGGFAFDSYDKEEKQRVGHAYGIDHIKATLHTVGVRRWENLVGQRVIVLNANQHSWGGTPVGFASLEGDRVLIFKAHFDAVKARLDARESVKA